MFDNLFLILISVFVPVIVFTGFKIFKCKNYRKLIITLTLVLLALEIIRFFCNAALYPDAITPSNDLKFGYITLLCIVALFATFNKSKFAGEGLLRNIFCLTALIPVLLAFVNPEIYVNELDVNGLCKAMYMLECGFALTIAALYVFEKKIKINPMNILWAILFVVISSAIDAFFIWYWDLNSIVNFMWYFGWTIALISIILMYTINVIYHKIIERKKAK